MARSSVDLMSSPDPLNDTMMDSLPPMTRRVTRSQASSRYTSVPSISPRKRIFHLDVGNEKSPQRILVTVEAGSSDKENVSRKLFSSPSKSRVIRRNEKSTTTTVPLRGLSDDEGPAMTSDAATPRKRGRPPKSGTPKPKPAAKKRATPIRKTPRFPRNSKILESDGPLSEDATPKPAPAARKATKRKASTPARTDGSTPQGTATRKRGRPRRTLLSGDLVETGEQSILETSAQNDSRPDSMPLELDDPSNLPSNFGSALSDNNEDGEEDIWMANLSEPPTPAERHESSPQDTAWPDAREPSFSPAPTEEDPVDVIRGATPMVIVAQGQSSGSDFQQEVRRGEDTIMLGEDFTMISVNSLPSMQPNSSIPPADEEDLGHTTNLIINRTLESLRQSHSQAEVKAPVADDGTKSAHSLEPQPINDGTMFESPRLSEGTASSRQPSRSPKRSRTTPLSKQLALKSLQKEDAATGYSALVLDSGTPRSAADKDGGSELLNEEQNTYEDSFSEIPEAILDAATPGRVPNLDFDTTEEQTEEHEEQYEEDYEGGAEVTSPHESVPKTSRSNSVAESNRLLTPSDTPSPVQSNGPRSALKQPQSTQTSDGPSEMGSSPPAAPPPRPSFREFISRHSRQNSTETPLNDMFLPTLQPPVDNAHQAKNLLAAPTRSSSRPALSPIVRTGRALQNIMSDPPSPSGGSSTLGSPFRGGGGRSSRSNSHIDNESKGQAMMNAALQPSPDIPVEEPIEEPMGETLEEPREAFTQEPAEEFVEEFMEEPMGEPVGEPVEEPVEEPVAEPMAGPAASVVGRQRSWSQSLNPFGNLKKLVMDGAHALSPRIFAAPAVEDPFHSGEAGIAPPLSASSFKLRFVGSGQKQAGPDLSNRADSQKASVPGDSEMDIDWEAERSPSPSPTRPANRQLFRQRSSSVFATRNSSSYRHAEHDEPTSGAEMDAGSVDHEEDEDIWAIEAQRPSPKLANPPTKRPSEVSAPARGKLPSPWRQNSKRLVYKDERAQNLASTNDNMIVDVAESSRLDEFSLLSQQLHDKAPQKNAEAEKRPLGRVDLSNFFSSPAPLPGAHPPNAPSFVAGNAKASSGLSQPPLRATNPATASAPVAQKEFNPSPLRRKFDLFSPARPSAESLSASVEPASSGPDDVASPHSLSHSPSPATPKQTTFAHVPQKRNFTPRSGQAESTLFKPTSSTAPNPALQNIPKLQARQRAGRAEITPPTSQTDRTRTPEQDQSMLRRLPERDASPTKSCLRSPLKPRTPGRVVEFTSSTLSPLAQAQVRSEQRVSLGPEKVPSLAGLAGRRPSLSPDKAQAQPQPQARFASAPAVTTARGPVVYDDKENSSAVGRRAPSPSKSRLLAQAMPLSRSMWSRAHWVRLDELLQLRRQAGALEFQLRCGAGSSSSSSRSSALLGKQVSAQGEAMVLQEWHLEVVDAFRDEVGGWDEGVVAKRLFALIVGEERRRSGRYRSSLEA